MNLKKLPEASIVVKAIAELLVSNEKSDDFEKRYLKKEKLDYTIASLKHIDEYLEHVRKKRSNLSQEQLTTIILRCGAYSGEVIKKNIDKNFSWSERDKDVIKEFGESVLTIYTLQGKETKTVIFPMAKVEKFLPNGKTDSIYFYAQVLLEDHKN